MSNQDALKHIVTSQLAGRHGGRPRTIGPNTPKPAPEPFLARHPRQAVDGVGVVASLRGGQSGVVLHAHVQHVGYVPHQATGYAGDGGHGDQHGEGGRVVFGGEAGFELFIDAEARGRVGDLAEERGGETVVEAGDAVVADDVEDGAGHGFGGVAGAHL